MKERDEKYYDAVKAVLTKERAGVSFLQRELGLGYAHAARYIDLMIEDGILKREDSKPWLLQILVSLEEWLRKNPRQNK